MFMNWAEVYCRCFTIENLLFIFVTMFFFDGFMEISNYIYPPFLINYGAEATFGNYFFVPVFLIFYGVLIYFFGLLVINRKVYDHSGIFNIKAKQIKKRINKYQVYFLPIQYWGAISFCIGFIVLLVQIIYRIIFM